MEHGVADGRVADSGADSGAEQKFAKKTQGSEVGRRRRYAEMSLI